jgi:tetratricopeptide (TPR) repeat protein
MIAAQAAIIIAPSIAARIHPSLELRSLMWRSGIDLLEDSGPMGTGTARSRLALFSEGGERMQVLAGPDSRVDFLHSEILALHVEQGVSGAMAILALLYLFAARRFTPARGAILLCCWPLLAMDLPLATPLGALPAAFGLAWALGPGRGRMLAVPRRVMIPAMVAALLWASLVVAGNRSLERGLRLGTAGRSAESAEELGRASVFIPWEERALFYRAVALARDGRPEEALEAIDGFLGAYPGYWRAWAMKGDLQRACGAGAPAAESYLRAVLEAPAGTDSLGLTAFNAAAETPGDSAEASVLAQALLTAGSQIPRGDPVILVEFARRSARTAAMVPGRDVDVFSALLKTALWNLLEAAAIPGVDMEDVAGVLGSFRPLASLVAARDPGQSAVMDGLIDSIEAAVILDTSR